MYFFELLFRIKVNEPKILFPPTPQKLPPRLWLYWKHLTAEAAEQSPLQGLCCEHRKERAHVYTAMSTAEGGFANPPLKCILRAPPCRFVDLAVYHMVACVHLMAPTWEPVKPVECHRLCVNRQQLSYPTFTSKHAHFPFLLWFAGTLWLSFQTSGKYLHFCSSCSSLCEWKRIVFYISPLQRISGIWRSGRVLLINPAVDKSHCMINA